jgi:DNA-binding transcriptional MocR family regulator
MISQDLASHTLAHLNGENNLYKRVALRISELIEHGTLRAGERVPSVRKCSQQQDVSIATVMQAYRLLEDRGLIEARPQSGYYVRARRWTPPPEPAMYKPVARPSEVKVADLILQFIKAGRNPKLVRLGASLPSPEMIPFQALQRTVSAVGRRSPLAANSYDAPPGNRDLRIQVARRALEAGCLLSPDDIITTVGVTEALNLLARRCPAGRCHCY